MLEYSDLSLRRVEELVLPVPLSQWQADPALVERHRQRLVPWFIDAEVQQCWLVFQTWVLRLGGRTIVVDPCNGNGRDRPAMPFVHRLDTLFLERFEATGTRPEEVDYVFCTHLHCDHCGWNTRLRAGRLVPTFPNARYVMVRRELDRWDPQRASALPMPDYNIGVYEDSIAPIIEHGLAELVGDRHELLPGVSVIPTYGHTLGHSALRVETPQRRIYFTGDVFHHPLQVSDPRLTLGGEDDPAAAIQTRIQLRQRLFDEEALMVPAHFPASHAGYVRQGADGEFCFEALRLVQADGAV